MDVNGGSVLAGDVLEYTINVVNSGNDTAVNTVLADLVPAGVTYKPGSIQISSGANTGAKTDATGDDQAEYDAGTKTVTVRLGTGANATQGGVLAVGETTVVKFQVTVDAGASGVIENQASISAAGLLGAPASNWPTDGNGSGPGSPPTPIVVDQCQTDAQCSAPTPKCDTTPNPNVCVECLGAADCSGNTPVCNATTKTCEGCSSDSQCGGATPACQPSGACGQCSATNSTACTGATPVCDTAAGSCVGCVTSADCSGTTPVCNTTSKTCQGCATDSDCSGKHAGMPAFGRVR